MNIPTLRPEDHRLVADVIAEIENSEPRYTDWGKQQKTKWVFLTDYRIRIKTHRTKLTQRYFRNLTQAFAASYAVTTRRDGGFYVELNCPVPVEDSATV